MACSRTSVRKLSSANRSSSKARSPGDRPFGKVQRPGVVILRPAVSAERRGLLGSGRRESQEGLVSAAASAWCANRARSGWLIAGSSRASSARRYSATVWSSGSDSSTTSRASSCPKATPGPEDAGAHAGQHRVRHRLRDQLAVPASASVNEEWIARRPGIQLIGVKRRPVRELTHRLPLKADELEARDARRARQVTQHHPLRMERVQLRDPGSCQSPAPARPPRGARPCVPPRGRLIGPVEILQREDSGLT